MSYKEFKKALQKEMLVRGMQKAGFAVRLELIPENARRSISFSLLNKEMNKVLLEDIAQENTETANYICKRVDDIIQEIMLNSEFGGKAVDEKLLTGYSPLYVLSNPKMMDGSCAILSRKFMKTVARQIGTDELYILPSSRHEILVLDTHEAPDPAALKLIVMAVNREPDIVAKEDFLSDSVYEYNAKTGILSVWNNGGFFCDGSLFIV